MNNYNVAFVIHAMNVQTSIQRTRHDSPAPLEYWITKARHELVSNMIYNIPIWGHNYNRGTVLLFD